MFLIQPTHFLKLSGKSQPQRPYKQEAVTTACTRGFNIFAKFCCRQSKLLQSPSRTVVHFTVVRSQAILFIRLGVSEVISAVTLHLLPASKRQNISTPLDMFRHNNFACGFCLSIVALTATMCLYNVSCGDELVKRKKAKKHQYPTFPDQYLPTPLERSETL